jgi:hypothetical protein
MLPKEPAAKTPAKKAATTPAVEDTAAGANTQKRKPRKLNKEPTSTPAPTQDTPKTAAPSKTPTEVPSASELDALKSRVRGLEAKVEELYKAGAISDSRPARSPRRRGKGRKGSSSAQVPTLSTTSTINKNDARVQEVDDDDEEEEADEELVRLEGELEVARQDLESFRPRPRNSRTMSGDTEDIEEIPRESASGYDGGRQVTLSGSYRIPIPANVSVEDVKTIKSGVSAAQNVARSFLEQRRAAASLRASQSDKEPAPGQFSKPGNSKVPASKTGAAQPKPKRSLSSNMEVQVANNAEGGGKQSWGEWIGGYSMAITRAVGKIEHEAAMESQRVANGGGSGSGGGSSRPAAGGARRGSAPGTKKVGGKRPPAKAQISSEQVNGLMS